LFEHLKIHRIGARLLPGKPPKKKCPLQKIFLKENNPPSPWKGEEGDYSVCSLEKIEKPHKKFFNRGIFWVGIFHRTLRRLVKFILFVLTAFKVLLIYCYFQNYTG
jgi:hypothetical protein